MGMWTIPPESRKAEPPFVGEGSGANKLIHWISTHGLSVPFIVFLESMRPLASLNRHLTPLFRPFAEPFLEPELVEEFSVLITDPNGIDALLKSMESIEGNPGKDRNGHESAQ